MKTTNIRFLIPLFLILLSVLHLTTATKKAKKAPSDEMRAMNGHLPWGNLTRLLPVSTNDRVIKFAVAGDIMMARKVATTIEENENDFTLPFQVIKDELKGVDIKIANLEAQITESNRTKKAVKPCGSHPGGCCGLHCHFKTSTRVVEGLSHAGLNLMLLENNHIEDYARGRQDTIKTLNEHHIPWMDGNHPFQVFNYKGCNLSFINYDAFLAPHTEKKIQARIKRDLKSVEPTSFKTVLIHAGKEYAYSEIEKQRKLAFAAIDNGADIVIFSHAHVVLGHEMYKDKWIFWGLGNFVFDQFFNPRVKEFLMIKYDLVDCKQVANMELVMGEITHLNQPTPGNSEIIEHTIMDFDPPKPPSRVEFAGGDTTKLNQPTPGASEILETTTIDVEPPKP